VTVFELVAAYIVLAVLLLSLNLTSLWRWRIKAAAIMFTTVFFAITYRSVNDLMGWPTTQRLPPRFNLVSTLISEPNKKTHDPGGIYLWAEELSADNVPSGRPRSYQLNYSDALARKVSSAQEKRDRGVDVMGRVYDDDPGGQERQGDIKMGEIRKSDEQNAATDTVPFMDDGTRLGFEELPPIVLPDKGPL